MNKPLLGWTHETQKVEFSVRQRWDLYFLVATPLLAATLFYLSRDGLPETILVSLLIVIPTVVYIAFFSAYRVERDGQISFRSKSGLRSWVFGAVVLICLWISCWYNNNSIFAQFIVIPELFIAFEYWAALGNVILLNFGFGLIGVFQSLSSQTNIGILFAPELVSVLFSAMIGSAIDHLDTSNRSNIELLASLKEKQQIIKQLSRQEGVEAERQRIAGELHDTIAQSLASILALSRAATLEIENHDIGQALDHLSMISEASQESLDDSRRLIANSSPVGAHNRGLEEALERTVDSCIRESGLTVHFEYSQDLPLLTSQAQVAILRIVQESLRNIQKHAEADCVSVSIALKDEQHPFEEPFESTSTEQAQQTNGHRQTEQSNQPQVTVRIEDDGKGFVIGEEHLEQVNLTGKGYGCIDMRTRTEQFGGTFRIISTLNKGTTVTAAFPLIAIERQVAQASGIKGSVATS